MRKLSPELRVERAHKYAVEIAQRYKAATPGSLKRSALFIRWQNAERKFEAALSALSAGKPTQDK